MKRFISNWNDFYATQHCIRTISRRSLSRRKITSKKTGEEYQSGQRALRNSFLNTKYSSKELVNSFGR